jgi:hypothetical protein
LPQLGREITPMTSKQGALSSDIPSPGDFDGHTLDQPIGANTSCNGTAR